MTPRRHSMLAASTLGFVTIAGLTFSAQVPPTPAPAPANPARQERLAWFHEAKYGLFIHWGLYSIQPASGRGSSCQGSASGS